MKKENTKEIKKPRPLKIGGTTFVEVKESMMGGWFIAINGHMLPAIDIRRIQNRIVECKDFLESK